MGDAPLMLSVSGLRGIVDQSLTPAVARRYGAAFGSWVRTRVDAEVPHVVIGRDSRPSGDRFATAVAQGLQSVGCRVTHLGIASTPAISVMLTHLNADGGMIITASHNPDQWNGIKALTHEGGAPTADQAGSLVELFRQTKDVPESPLDPQRLGESDEAAQVHVERVLANVDVAAIREWAAGRTVVVDSVCGAGGSEARALLEALGVPVKHIHAEPTGQFPHTPEPTAENLTELCDVVRREKAVIGFAQDPDADRLAIVDGEGRYIGEEHTLALTAMQMLRRNPESQAAAFATNLSTSRMIDDVAVRSGASVRRTAVGEANVVVGMKQAQAVLGGEGNGGVIWPAVGYVRNSLAGIALTLELLAQSGKSLEQIVADIPAYTIVKHKMPIQPGMTERAIAAVAGRWPDAQQDRKDGLRLDFPDSWIHVRPSNTEPILRVIAEAPTAEFAQGLVEAACDAIAAG